MVVQIFKSFYYHFPGIQFHIAFCFFFSQCPGTGDFVSKMISMGSSQTGNAPSRLSPDSCPGRVSMCYSTNIFKLAIEL